MSAVETSNGTTPATVEDVTGGVEDVVAALLGKKGAGTFATSREAFEKEAATLTDPARTWRVSTESAIEASKDAALIESRLRLHFLNEKGLPDLAGKTGLWRKFAQDEIGKAYSLAGMTDSQRKDFKQAVMTQRSRLGITFRVAAEYAVEHSNVGAQTVKVAGKDVSVRDLVNTWTPGTKAPAALKKEAAKLYAAQLDKSGKRIPGFTEDRIPAKFGFAAEDDDSGSGDGQTPGAGFEPAWKKLRKGLTENITAGESGEQLHILLTFLADGLIGKPQAAPEHDLRKDVSVAIEKYRACAALLTALADNLDNVAGAKKEHVAEYRHQG